MQGIKWGNVLRSISSASPLSAWMTLSFMWLCAQMSLARIWVGGHPALCLWPMDQHLPGLNRLGLSLYLRGRGSWRPPASLSWTALTLMSVWVCVFGMNLYKWHLACVEQINDWIAFVFFSIRMRLLAIDQPAAPVWLHLWWMIRPRSLRWGRKVSQELFHIYHSSV